MAEVAKKTKKPIDLKAERDKDREMVKGIFKFYECPGGTLSFVYRKYKQDDVESFTLVDGQVYSLPLGVAKHLNKNGWYPRYEHIPGDSSVQVGIPVQSFGALPTQNIRLKTKVRRFGFQSLEFVDTDDISEEGKKIAEVEFVEP